ncbi:flagellar protein [Metabacillus litoralis]|uniref:flagellin N-terminal helical domain-containing protein n=1 Tax=Metabacillus litoralis TaxID=152268 RepID=UPI001B98DF93|nr:flagellin [Metabacillus litoralis]UHA61571.1 flagellar protein [Metabacillus litoralis]
MRINHNIQALNAYKNLSQTMGQTSKTLEKLSSGLRINRAADDAAGLAISEKMRSQIRGLETAERNSLDAISLIQTAEGALNETHSILQRMRELSVQAANGTLEDSDREAIQMEINQLTYEIDRIADTTQFNTKKLLSGSAEGRAFAEVNTSEVAYTGNGTWSGVVTAEPTEPAKVEIKFDRSLGELTAADLEGKFFRINDKTYELDMDGTNTVTTGHVAVNISGWIDSAGNDADIITNIKNLMDKLEGAINLNDNQSFNIVNNQPTDVDPAIEGAINAGTLSFSTTNPMSPKDVENLGVNNEVASDLITLGVTINDPLTNTPTNKLVANSESAQSKPIAITFSEVPKTGDALKIDGLTIEFNSPEKAYGVAEAGKAIIDVTGKDLETVLNEINDVIKLAINDPANPVPALAPVHSVSNNSLVLGTIKTDDGNTSGVTNGLDIALIDGDFEADKGKNLEVALQIGANASESLTLSLGVMDAATLGIARNGDFSTLSTAGVNAVLGVNVSTANAAQQAITAFDKAISLVSAERSKLGAFQNRLEHTVTNLQTANENLTSAESRIRDTDMAKSMTEYTKNNILNQAGQAMLAQANQLPQGILQLLK